MKILFVQKLIGISGSELYLLQLLPELKRRGHDVEMLVVYHKNVAATNKRFKDLLALDGITTIELYGHHPLSPLLILKIVRLLKKKQYDLIQSNLIHADLWMSLIKKIACPALKLISVKHTYSPSYQAKYGYDFKFLKTEMYYWIERFACKEMNANITISKGLYHVFTKGNISSTATTRNIYYGLTLINTVNDFKPIIDTDEKYVLIIGRLVPFKGHEYLIRAWKKVHELHPDLKLYIVGDGALRVNLERMVAEEGHAKSILFIGHLTDPHPYISRSLFTVITSIWEGFGLILLESWLHKKPVIAFDVPAMNEIIKQEENGFLVKLKDTNELAEKISYLVQNPNIAQQYGEQGYQKLINYYTLKRMTDETLQIYENIINDKPLPIF